MAIDNIKKFVVFDFFSGIWGFHLALNQILNIKIKEVFPFDVNIIANDVYNHNFSINPNTLTLERFSLNNYERMCNKLSKNYSIYSSFYLLL